MCCQSLPRKQRHHPQKEAIKVLCIMSLLFGGLLWPFAWLWAYTKPVGYRLAYGRDKHDDYYAELAAKGGCRHRVPCRRGGPRSTAPRDRESSVALARGRSYAIREGAPPARTLNLSERTLRGEIFMLELIVCTYALVVWLVFIKLKLLPWNIKSQVGVVAFGAFAPFRAGLHDQRHCAVHRATCASPTTWWKSSRA